MRRAPKEGKECLASLHEPRKERENVNGLVVAFPNRELDLFQPDAPYAGY